MLVILAAGDRTLFDDCQSCFQAMGKHSFFLGNDSYFLFLWRCTSNKVCFVFFVVCIIIGEVGSASKMNLVLQLMMGVAVAGVAEGMALADRAGLQQRDVLEIFELTTLACPLLLEKGKGNTFLLFFLH
jgi:3-hydroxyisobutyrate dehydrogenase-like beta-hydroxyacid dehydrogenase